MLQIYLKINIHHRGLNKQSTNIRKKDSARFSFFSHHTYKTLRLLTRDVSHVIKRITVRTVSKKTTVDIRQKKHVTDTYYNTTHAIKPLRLHHRALYRNGLHNWKHTNTNTKVIQDYS